MPDFRPLVGLSDDVALGLVRAQKSGVAQASRPRKTKGRPGVPEVDEVESVLGAVDNVSNVMNIGSIGLIFGGMAGGGLLGFLHRKTGNKAIGKAHNVVTTVAGAKVSDIPGLGRATEALTTLPMRGLALMTDGLDRIGLTGAVANRYARQVAKHEALMDRYAAVLFERPFANEATNEAMQVLKQMHSSGINSLAQHMHEAHGSASAFSQAFDKAYSALRNSNPSLEKAMKKFGTHAQKAGNAHNLAQGLGSMSAHLRAAPAKIAQGNLGHVMMNTAITTGVLTMDARLGWDAVKAYGVLKEMHADMTHQQADDVGFAEIMFGKASPAVAAARAQWFKEFGPSGVIALLNTGVNIDFVARNKMSMMGFAAMIGLGMAQESVRGALHGNLLPAYHTIKQAQQAHEAVPAEVYATLIGEASPELAKRGGMNCESAKALGNEYATLQMSVRDVLCEVSNGKMHKRLERLQAEYAAAHPDVQNEGAKSDHVARLQGRKDAAHQEVKGPHTKKLANAAVVAQTATPAPAPGGGL